MMMMRSAMSCRARLPSLFNPLNRSFVQTSRSLRVKAQGDAQPPQPQSQADVPTGVMQSSQDAPKKQDAMSKRENFTMAPPMRMSSLIGQLQNEIDSIMGAFETPFFSPFSSDLGRPLSMMDRRPQGMMMPGGGNMMAMDVTEDEKQFTIQAEVPGFTKEDIKVTLSPDQMLTVSGNMKEEDKDEGGPMKRRTLRMSSFTRRLQLPSDADMESIKATTNHGVLTICVPKTGKPAPQLRDIPVE